MADVIEFDPPESQPVADVATGALVERVAGPAQAALLIFTSCLSVLGIVLIAPVQPRMAAAFATTPGVDILVPLAITMPAVMITLLAPLAGRIADRTGRVRLLIVALIVYAIFGTAPLWLPTLELVVVSRAGLGVAEAGIMTCCTALLADLWTGPARNRILGLQVLAVSLSAVVVVAAGGALGASGWRTPFWAYFVSLFIALAVPRLLWNPDERPTGALPPLHWQRLLVPFVMTFLGGIVFYTPLLELSLVLDHLGVTSTSTIGLISAVAALASAAGAVVFGRVSDVGPRVLLTVALGIAGVGILALGLGSTVPVIVVGAIVCSLGCGILLPTLLLWVVAPLTPAQRGRATGVWYSCAQAGQFACPLVVLGVGAVVGGISGGLVVLGAAALVLAGAASRIRTEAGDLPAENSAAGA